MLLYTSLYTRVNSEMESFEEIKKQGIQLQVTTLNIPLEKPT